MPRVMLLIGLVLTLILGCSTGPSKEEYFLTGQVLGVDGEPAAGANVGIVFQSRELDSPALVGTGLTPFRTDPGCYGTLKIFDYVGQLVRIICENEPLGLGFPGLWDELDDEGLPVSNGFYRWELTTTGPGCEGYYEGWYFMNSLGWEYGIEVGANAITDESGEFIISMDLLPVGEGFTVMGVDPNDLIDMEVLSTIDLRASMDTDRVTQPIDLGDMTQDLDVVLQLEPAGP